MSFLLAGKDYKLVDDFEDQDISEYNGDTHGFSITSNSKEGGYALEQVESDDAEYIYSHSGLDNYPSRGDVFRIWIYVVNRAIFGWAQSGTGNNPGNNRDYGFGLDTSLGRITLRKDGNNFMNDKYISLPSDSWYEVEVDFSNTITAELFNESGSSITTISATDSDYDSGGINIWTNNSNGNIYDFWRIVN